MAVASAPAIYVPPIVTAQVGPSFGLTQGERDLGALSPSLLGNPTPFGTAGATLTATQQAQLQYLSQITGGAVGTDNDPSGWTQEDAATQTDRAIARIGQANPDLAKALAEMHDPDSVEEDRGFLGDLLHAGASLLHVTGLDRVFEVIGRSSHLAPEFVHGLLNGEGLGTAAWTSFADSITGKSQLSWDDVLAEDLGMERNIFTAVAGFIGDVATDPLSYMTFGTGGIGRTAAGKVVAEKAMADALKKGTVMIGEEAVDTGLLFGAIHAQSGLGVDEAAKYLFGLSDAGKGLAEKAGSGILARLRKAAGQVHPDAVGGMLYHAGSDLEEKALQQILRIGDDAFRASTTVGWQRVTSEAAAKFGVDKGAVDAALRDTVRKGNVVAPRGTTAFREGKMLYEEGKAAAASLGGIRFRASIPVFGIRMQSNRIPLLPSVMDFSVGRRFFAGLSGQVRLMKMVGIGEATMDDMRMFWEGGFKKLKSAEGNPAIAEKLSHGALHMGSIFYPLSEAIGGITAHLSPHAMVLRGGGLGAKYAGEAKQVAAHIAQQQHDTILTTLMPNRVLKNPDQTVELLVNASGVGKKAAPNAVEAFHDDLIDYISLVPADGARAEEYYDDLISREILKDRTPGGGKTDLEFLAVLRAEKDRAVSLEARLHASIVRNGEDPLEVVAAWRQATIQAEDARLQAGLKPHGTPDPEAARHELTPEDYDKWSARGPARLAGGRWKTVDPHVMTASGGRIDEGVLTNKSGAGDTARGFHLWQPNEAKGGVDAATGHTGSAPNLSPDDGPPPRFQYDMEYESYETMSARRELEAGAPYKADEVSDIERADYQATEVTDEERAARIAKRKKETLDALDFDTTELDAQIDWGKDDPTLEADIADFLEREAVIRGKETVAEAESLLGHVPTPEEVEFHLAQKAASEIHTNASGIMGEYAAAHGIENIYGTLNVQGGAKGTNLLTENLAKALRRLENSKTTKDIAESMEQVREAVRNLDRADRIANNVMGGWDEVGPWEEKLNRTMSTGTADGPLPKEDILRARLTDQEAEAASRDAGEAIDARTGKPVDRAGQAARIDDVISSVRAVVPLGDNEVDTALAKLADAAERGLLAEDDIIPFLEDAGVMTPELKAHIANATEMAQEATPLVPMAPAPPLGAQIVGQPMMLHQVAMDEREDVSKALYIMYVSDYGLMHKQLDEAGAAAREVVQAIEEFGAGNLDADVELIAAAIGPDAVRTAMASTIAPGRSTVRAVQYHPDLVNLPPVPADHTRIFRGGARDVSQDSGKWWTMDYEEAKKYAERRTNAAGQDVPFPRPLEEELSGVTETYTPGRVYYRDVHNDQLNAMRNTNPEELRFAGDLTPQEIATAMDEGMTETAEIMDWASERRAMGRDYGRGDEAFELERGEFKFAEQDREAGHPVFPPDEAPPPELTEARNVQAEQSERGGLDEVKEAGAQDDFAARLLAIDAEDVRAAQGERDGLVILPKEVATAVGPTPDIGARPLNPYEIDSRSAATREVGEAAQATESVNMVRQIETSLRQFMEDFRKGASMDDWPMELSDAVKDDVRAILDTEELLDDQIAPLVTAEMKARGFDSIRHITDDGVALTVFDNEGIIPAARINPYAARTQAHRGTPMRIYTDEALAAVGRTRKSKAWLDKVMRDVVHLSRADAEARLRLEFEKRGIHLGVNQRVLETDPVRVLKENANRVAKETKDRFLGRAMQTAENLGFSRGAFGAAAVGVERYKYIVNEAGLHSLENLPPEVQASADRAAALDVKQLPSYIIQSHALSQRMAAIEDRLLDDQARAFGVIEDHASKWPLQGVDDYAESLKEEGNKFQKSYQRLKDSGHIQDIGKNVWRSSDAAERLKNGKPVFYYYVNPHTNRVVGMREVSAGVRDFNPASQVEELMPGGVTAFTHPDWQKGAKGVSVGTELLRAHWNDMGVRNVDDALKLIQEQVFSPAGAGLNKAGIKDLVRSLTAESRRDIAASLKALEEDLMPEAEALGEVQRIITRMQTRGAPPLAALVPAENAANMTGMELLTGVPGLEDMAMPSYMAQELRSAITGYAPLDGAHRAWRRFNSWWKELATWMWPGFHIRNAEGAWFNNFLGGVKQEDYVLTRRVRMAERELFHGDPNSRRWANMKLRAKDPDLIKSLKRGGTFQMYGRNVDELTYGDLAVATAGLGITASNGRAFAEARLTVEAIEKKHGKYGLERVPLLGRGVSKYKEGMQGAGTMTENVFRTAAFVRGLRDSGNIMEARAFTMVRHGDYYDLTDWEYGFIRDLIPFYKWMRTNTPFQIHQLLENPAKLLAFQKAQGAVYTATGRDYREERHKMPEWMQQSFTVPLGKGDAFNAVMLDLPMSDMFMGGREFVSSFLPTVRPFLESYVYEKQTFSGSPIEGKPVPLPSFFKPIAPLLASLKMVQQGPDGTAYIDDKLQNVLNIIPVFSRLRNFIYEEPTRAHLRSNTVASIAFGIGLRPVDEEQMTSNELDFYYSNVLPMVNHLKDMGYPLPTTDDIDAAIGSTKTALEALGIQPSEATIAADAA